MIEQRSKELTEQRLKELLEDKSLLDKLKANSKAKTKEETLIKEQPVLSNDKQEEFFVKKSFATLHYEAGLGTITPGQLNDVLRKADKYPHQLTEDNKRTLVAFNAFMKGRNAEN